MASIQEATFQLFCEEADEHLAILEEGLLQLEREPGAGAGLVDRLFRSAHTIKGSAALLKLQGASAVAHRLEDTLEALRDGRLRPSRSRIDALLFALDQVRELVHQGGGAGTEFAGPLAEVDRRLSEEVARSQRYATRLSVLMLDIDHFKHINDTCGHKAGDLVLHHVGKLILNTLRTADIATRYGGEELLVVAPNTSITEATILAERIRQYIETHPLVLESENQTPREISATVSIGVAEFTEQVASGDVLICNADEALYRAKKKGRNRVESYSAARQKMVA